MKRFLLSISITIFLFFLINKATAQTAPVEYAYITNQDDGTVSVINIANNIVETVIPVGENPTEISVSPDGSRVYEANQGDGSISVINTSTNKVIATITGITANGLLVSPDGSLLYLTDTENGQVIVVSTANNTVLSNLPGGSGPTQMAISPDGRLLYVTDVLSSSVRVINTATGSVVINIAVGENPGGISMSADGSRVYVANFFSGTVSVINTANNTVISSFNVGNNPDGVTITPDGSKVYVSDYGTNTVAVINTLTNGVIFVTVGTHPLGLSVSPDGSNVFVANSASNTVSVISTISNAVISTINVGKSPNALGNFITGIRVTPASILTSPVTGNIAACAGSVSISPDIQQFTVTGSNLTGDVTATAPAGFEVSLSAGSGYGSSVILKQFGGMLSSTLVYVCSSASAAVGPLSGNVVLTSATAISQNVAVTGIVNALPTINPASSQTVLNGKATKAVNFLGTANTFSWVNDTPGIGLPVSSTGNIASFTAVNTGSSPVTATITATPINAAFAYVANESDGTISVINTVTNLVVNTLTVGPQPIGEAVNADGTRAYIVNNNAGNSSGTVSVINTANNNTIATITVGSSPDGISVSPDGSHVYVANQTSGTVSVIDAATNKVTATITVGLNPYGISAGTDGSNVYVTNSVSNTVSVINTATNTVTATIPVGTYPVGVSVSPDGSSVYVTNQKSNNVSVISTTSSTVIAAIAVGTQPVGVSISPDGTTLYVANADDNTVSVINTANNTIVTTIPVGTLPYGISVSPDGGSVYVANEGSNTVSVINVPTNSVTATVNVGTSPYAFGSFIRKGVVCDGEPIKFTITVNPLLVSPVVTIPNAFTPNNDGINDTWNIKNLDQYPNNTVDIFNRYGQKIYSSINYGIPWDGTFKGKNLPSGTYYYVIDLKNGNKTLSGYVALIR